LIAPHRHPHASPGWRKGGRPAAEFEKMDLDGDGLLTQEEYRRHLKLRDLKGEKKGEEGEDDE
jgi:hypothetical protein